MPNSEQNESIDDLWPDNFNFDLESIAPPFLILKQQASLLGQKTRNIVVGQATSSTHSNETVFLQFTISAPALSGYSLVLLYMESSITSLYPVGINFDFLEGKADDIPIEDIANNEKDLKFKLKRFFGHPKVHELIQSLIAQSLATSS